MRREVALYCELGAPLMSRRTRSLALGLHSHPSCGWWGVVLAVECHFAASLEGPGVQAYQPSSLSSLLYHPPSLPLFPPLASFFSFAILLIWPQTNPSTKTRLERGAVEEVGEERHGPLRLRLWHLVATTTHGNESELKWGVVNGGVAANLLAAAVSIGGVRQMRSGPKRGGACLASGNQNVERCTDMAS